MMGLFDRLFGGKEKVLVALEAMAAKSTPAEPPVPREKKVKEEPKTAKQIATDKKEPYVNIVSLDVDLDNLHQGAFELDWNDKFVANLIRAGYQMDPKDTDSDIVDRWFTAVCRNIVLETYEQYEAMNPERDRVVKTRNIGDGRSEVS
jgi:hypothetical protein